MCFSVICKTFPLLTVGFYHPSEIQKTHLAYNAHRHLIITFTSLLPVVVIFWIWSRYFTATITFLRHTSSTKFCYDLLYICIKYFLIQQLIQQSWGRRGGSRRAKSMRRYMRFYNTITDAFQIIYTKPSKHFDVLTEPVKPLEAKPVAATMA